MPRCASTQQENNSPTKKDAKGTKEEEKGATEEVREGTSHLVSVSAVVRLAIAGKIDLDAGG